MSCHSLARLEPRLWIRSANRQTVPGLRREDEGEKENTDREAFREGGQGEKNMWKCKWKIRKSNKKGVKKGSNLGGIELEINRIKYTSKEKSKRH